MPTGRGLVARLLQVLDDATPTTLSAARTWATDAMNGPDQERILALLDALGGEARATPRAQVAAEPQPEEEVAEVEPEPVEAPEFDDVPSEPQADVVALRRERDEQRRELISILADDEKLDRQGLIDAIRNTFGYDTVAQNDYRSRRELVEAASERFIQLEPDGRKRVLANLRKRVIRGRSSTLDDWSRR